MRPSQLGEQSSSRAASANGDHRTWTHNHPTKPRFLAGFEQNGSLGESMTATAGGEPAHVSLEFGYGSEPLTWNAAGMLHRYKESSYSFDVFGATTLVVTGAGGVTTQIVSVGADFEYDIGASRANKHFTLGGVRIASLATSYTACSAPCPASAPPALRIALRFAEPLAAPAAAALFALGLASLASLTLRRRTPVWLSLPGVGVLSLSLVALPYTAQAATLTTGAGKYGRHAEPILAYLVDHLGTVRAAVNRDGIVVETRDYAPFGESIAHAGAFSVQHRFTGQPQDDLEGGLYNYGARFYNPKWGRFVSPDELVQGFDSQGLNPFAYVLNRPTSGTDPTGNFGGFDGTVGVGSYFSGGIGSVGGIGGGFSSGGASYRWFAAGPPDPDRSSRRLRVDPLRRLASILSQQERRPVVVNSTIEALRHYFRGRGEPAELGPDVRDAIINSRDQQYRYNRIRTGETPNVERGVYGVDVEAEGAYFVGDTPIEYETSCGGGTCTTTFTSTGDGFWDVVRDVDRGGPSGELPGGKPFPFVPFSWQRSFPDPRSSTP